MSEVTGDVEKEGRVLVVKRIHVAFKLKLPSDFRAVAERVLGVYAEACPLARSVKGCIDISSSLEFIDE